MSIWGGAHRKHLAREMAIKENLESDSTSILLVKLKASQSDSFTAIRAPW